MVGIVLLSDNNFLFLFIRRRLRFLLSDDRFGAERTVVLHQQPLLETGRVEEMLTIGDDGLRVLQVLVADTAQVAVLY